MSQENTGGERNFRQAAIFYKAGKNFYRVHEKSCQKRMKKDTFSEFYRGYFRFHHYICVTSQSIVICMQIKTYGIAKDK